MTVTIIHVCVYWRTHLAVFDLRIERFKLLSKICYHQLGFSTHHQADALRPIASIAFVEGKAVGSSQHSNLAQGFVLTTSGGSTPRFRQINIPALNVFNLAFNLHGTTQNFVNQVPVGVVRTHYTHRPQAVSPD